MHTVSSTAWGRKHGASQPLPAVDAAAVLAALVEQRLDGS
jgi:hypothetical protein